MICNMVFFLVVFELSMSFVFAPSSPRMVFSIQKLAKNMVLARRTRPTRFWASPPVPRMRRSRRPTEAAEAAEAAKRSSKVLVFFPPEMAGYGAGVERFVLVFGEKGGNHGGYRKRWSC